MNAAAVQSETAREDSLQQRLAAVGLAWLACDVTGDPIRGEQDRDHWLTKLAWQSPLFAAAMRIAAAQWADQETLAQTQVVPGLWMVPMAVLNRRRRIGYDVAVIVTHEFLHAEQLVAMCQSAGMDLALCQRMLGELPPVPLVEVPRLATLVRAANDDHLKLSAGDHAIESVGKQLAESYEEMNLLYTIITSMTVQERPERFVAIACQELLKTLPYAWIGTQFGEDRSRLKSLAGRLIVAGDSGQNAGNLRAAAIGLLATAVADEPIVFDPVSNPSQAGMSVLGHTALAHPVTSKGEVLGLLIAGNKQGADTAASSVDAKLLGATATHLAIFLENSALYDDLNAMFLGTLEALTASIDAKDRYTCGHSRRVAHLTQQLAQAIGLDERTCQRMHIAGLVHDVGKIGVPEGVLLKPGRLSPEEFAWIRRHPEMGHRILRDIPQLNDVLPGVLYHHERWDGAGYPEGLAREAIPLVARLIGLADSFDAMSSNRTYRASRSRRQVIDEIRACAGAQFDPDLASVFIDLDFTEYDRLVREHQATDIQASQREQAA